MTRTAILAQDRRLVWTIFSRGGVSQLPAAPQQCLQ
jgi:hypothetical protein